MDSDREMLVRVEQRLQDSISNYKQLVIDLKEVFGKIEIDSKSIVSIETNQKTMMENQKDVNFALSELNKKTDLKLSELNKKIDDEENERIAFQNDVKGGRRAYTWIFVVISGIATILSIISLLWQLRP